MKKRQFWTKAEARVLIDLWEKSTLDELQAKLKRERSQIISMVYEMRKAGFKLSKKRKVGERRVMLIELLKEYKNK